MQKAAMFGISQATFKILIETLRSFPQVEEAIIFSSCAKGHSKAGSDIDIAFKGREANIAIALDINVQLNERQPVPYYFDVVDYASLSNAELKNHIDRVGVSFL